MQYYELIEHTADIGLRIKGKDLKSLFKNAAIAMFEVMAERKAPASKAARSIGVKLAAAGLEELLVCWLNELLYLSAVKELFFTDYAINRINDKALSARVSGESIGNFRMKTEIKAATYYCLRIASDYSGYTAEVIFDV